jgi:signal transduction histidine kinase
MRPWQIVSASIGGLLIAITVAGSVGLALNQRVKAVTDRALAYDVALEDLGDDLRVAVLDVRHYHRNLIFAGPSRGGVADLERAYEQLRAAIAALDELGIVDPEVPQPAHLRAMSERYYANLRPALDLYERDPAGFTRVSDQELVRLGELAQAAQAIDRLGEQRAAAALASVEQASATATVVLLTVLAGLFLVGTALALVAMRMVNEVRGLYAAQQAAAEGLARALRMKTDFIADASHELRTPLTVLRGNAEVGLALDSTCVHRDILEEIVKESARMARLVDDLLLLARSDSGALPLEPQRVDARAFVAGLIESADVLARQYGVAFRAEVAGEGQARIDPARIEQAVFILVDNACKYGGPGGLVTLTSATRGGALTIAVADGGPGIPPAELPLVFERFYRVDKTRARKQGGAGLGLAIAKTIVEAHGGRIEAASRLGEGTTMTLVVPLVAAPAGPVAGRATPERVR